MRAGLGLVRGVMTGRGKGTNHAPPYDSWPPGGNQFEKPISSTPESYYEWMSLSTAEVSLVPFTSSWKEAGMASVRLEAA